MVLAATIIPLMPMEVPPAAMACQVWAEVPGTQVAALSVDETGAGPDGQAGRLPLDPGALIARTGDVVLRRKDGAPAYHLAVVLDDAHQGVSHVSRGCDLFAATALHRLLQALLGLPVPVWHHHRLIRDADGRRLAKRDDARALATLRAAGATPDDVRAMVGMARVALT